MRRIEVRLLGRFEVLVDSRSVPAEAWAQRRATDLVKVLALAPGHRMPRDEVLEMLWPKLGPDAAAANLHKAASHARSALGDRGAVVLRGGVVEFAPGAEVSTDVERFERGEDSAYGGELLLRGAEPDRRSSCRRATERELLGKAEAKLHERPALGLAASS
jgi:DNA-binding SARP family transcriptional activator